MTIYRGLRRRCEIKAIFDSIGQSHLYYTPFSFWDDKDFYIQALVEKVDLKSLFASVFNEFYIPFANAGGWSTINGRDSLMQRFRDMEAEGRQCVLLYCGDHDPGGLNISEFLRPNMEELADAVGWKPDNLIIDRFGLNFDFIERQGLTWIDNLKTGAKNKPPLDDAKHPDHKKPYVQNYLRRFGARKVEANALVVRPNAGRELCRQAILKYLDAEDPQRYEAALKPYRAQVQEAVVRRLKEAAA